MIRWYVPWLVAVGTAQYLGRIAGGLLAGCWRLGTKTSLVPTCQWCLFHSHPHPSPNLVRLQLTSPFFHVALPHFSLVVTRFVHNFLARPPSLRYAPTGPARSINSISWGFKRVDEAGPRRGEKNKISGPKRRALAGLT